jgi:hypothetical protein
VRDLTQFPFGISPSGQRASYIEPRRLRAGN